jgi:dolichyl-diphosphooligosaccharide--protein glycosyltransferase
MAGYALSYIIKTANSYDIKVKMKKQETAFFGVGCILLVLLPTVLNNITLLFVFAVGGIALLSIGFTIKKSYSAPVFQRMLVFLKGEREHVNLLVIPLVIFLLFIISFNTAAGYFYSNSMGPMMNTQWYEAMDFLANETPENSNVLSWWDFGYIFQYYGKRPTVSDGGWGPRDPVADWFVSKPENWTKWEWYIKGKYHVDYILMDYTLPGKYGAISKIAYRGKQIYGIPQFTNSGVQPQGNKTIYEFSAGPYVIWVPFDSNTSSISGSPMFLIEQDGSFISKAYINELCTENGIAKIGTETNSMGGCLTFTKYGMFYVPEEVKNTIFTSLMFMDGWDLPVKKVFDNGLIKIYEVMYGNNNNEITGTVTASTAL